MIKFRKMKQTILITGASSGLGKATAKLFQSKGWNVVATMRNPENETELNSLEHVLVTKLDVLDINTIHNAVAEGIRQFGQIDVLVNNAGYGAYGPLEAFSTDQITRQFNTNVIGLLEVTRVVLPHFRMNHSGTIINISSIGGKMTFPLGALYHGTKFAVEGISESLSFEVDQFGGKIKIIEPGAIHTDFNSRSLDFSNNERHEEYQPLITKVMGAMQGFYGNASTGLQIAEVVYQAATDGTKQLRYTAGEDARMMVGLRQQSADETFTRQIEKQFGL
jgi:NADP-dependent 3-hydroxy acid dehydrogenase YdfG